LQRAQQHRLVHPHVGGGDERARDGEEDVRPEVLALARLLGVEELLEVGPARGDLAAEARDERVDDELEVGAPHLGEARVGVGGDDGEVVVADGAEVNRAGRGQQVGHDAEVALALAHHRDLLLVLLLAVGGGGRRDGDALVDERLGARVEVGEDAARHLQRRRAQLVARRAVHRDVVGEARVEPRLAVELPEQRDEVEHVEDAAGQVVRARRGVEAGRRPERVGERDVARRLLGRSHPGALQDVARVEVLHAPAQGRVEPGEVFPHQLAEDRGAAARGRRVPAGGVNRRHQRDEPRLGRYLDAEVAEAERRGRRRGPLLLRGRPRGRGLLV
jgi:hypothetical protein